MKKLHKLIGIALLAAAMVFSMAACGSSGNGNGNDSADKTALTAKIAEAEALLDTARVSVNGNDVAPAEFWVTQAEKTALETAIAAAQNVNDTAEDQDEVDAAVTTLGSAMTAFETAKKPGEQTSGFSQAQLNTLIANAEAKKAGVVTSADGTDIATNVKWVTSSVMNALNTAITNAKAATGPDFDAVYNALLTAYNAFTPVPGTKQSAGTAKSISITGLDSYNDEGAIVMLLATNTMEVIMANIEDFYEDRFEGIGYMARIEDNITEMDLYVIDGEPVEPWTGTGNYFVLLIIADMNDEKIPVLSISSTAVNFNNENTSIAFSQFNKIPFAWDFVDIYAAISGQDYNTILFELGNTHPDMTINDFLNRMKEEDGDYYDYDGWKEFMSEMFGRELRLYTNTALSSEVIGTEKLSALSPAYTVYSDIPFEFIMMMMDGGPGGSSDDPQVIEMYARNTGTQCWGMYSKNVSPFYSGTFLPNTKYIINLRGNIDMTMNDVNFGIFSFYPPPNQSEPPLHFLQKNISIPSGNFDIEFDVTSSDFGTLPSNNIMFSIWNNENWPGGKSENELITTITNFFMRVNVLDEPVLYIINDNGNTQVKVTDQTIDNSTDFSALTPIAVGQGSTPKLYENWESYPDNPFNETGTYNVMLRNPPSENAGPYTIKYQNGVEFTNGIGVVDWNTMTTQTP